MAQGSATHDLLHPNRVLIGWLSEDNSPLAVASLTQLYAGWVPEDRIITMNAWSSELSKITSNAFIAQRISSINSISAICEATDADVDDVSYAVGLEPRIGPHTLRAGIGFGGSCLRKDVLCLVYLAKSFGLTEVADYWQAVDAMNTYQNSRVSDRFLTQLGHTLNDSKIAVLGFSFKKDTTDTRNTLAVKIVYDFLGSAAAVSVFDPCVSQEQIWRDLKAADVLNTSAHEQLAVNDNIYDACRDANGIFIHTDWEVFRADGTVDWSTIARGMRTPRLLLCARGSLDIEQMEQLGFTVMRIGRKISAQ
jgi:UDPglucose 6-dehydrogenase